MSIAEAIRLVPLSYWQQYLNLKEVSTTSGFGGFRE
jgi:hypothetical protein